MIIFIILFYENDAVAIESESKALVIRMRSLLKLFKLPTSYKKFTKIFTNYLIKIMMRYKIKNKHYEMRF